VNVSYVLGNGQLISQRRGTTTSHYLPDIQGSTRALTTPAAAITDTYRYSAFGDIETQTGSTLNSYLYTGQQFDSSTGLYSLRARYYDAAVGRFLSRDTYPINRQNPMELNRYVYAAGNPVRWSDPSGDTLVSYALSIGKSAARGAAFGGFSGFAGGGIFMTLAGIGACGPRMQNWMTSLTQAERLDYLAQSAIVGAAFGGIAGIAAAISPAALGYTNAAIGGIGLGSSIVDMMQNEVNLCNVLGAGLAIGGGLSGGQSFTLSIPKFNILITPPLYAPGVGTIGGGGLSIATTGYVTISISSTGALLINNIVMMAASSGGGGSDDEDSRGSNNVPRIEVKKSDYPEAVGHIEDAQAAGRPSRLTIDRPGTDARRAEAMRGYPPRSGFDRDEYPPAMFEEGGAGASVRYIPPGDNRGAGAVIGRLTRPYPDGTQVDIVVVP
jgi:RHS repeat-associated protein